MRTALLLSALLLTAGLALTVAPASSAAPCGGVVDVACEGEHCRVYYLGPPFPPECIWSEPAYCILYVDARVVDPVCAGG